MAMTADEATDLAVAEIRRLGELCVDVDPGTPVPTCPAWDLGALLRHTGTVNRWAATMVGRSSQERLNRDAVDWDEPDDPAALAAWVRDGAEFVEQRFRDADPSTPMWAWGSPKTAAFWPRRMVHETGIHRADAEYALDRSPSFDAAAAVDGIEELLDNLPHAAYFRPHVAELRGDGDVLALVSPEASFTVTLRPVGFGGRRDAADADAALEAPSASDLLLTLYGRRSPAAGEITGKASLVEHWLENSRL